MPRSAITRALDFVYAMTWSVRFRIHDDEIAEDGFVFFEDGEVELQVWWEPEAGEDLLISVYKRGVWLGNIAVGRRGVDELIPIRTRRSTRRAIEALLDTGEVLK